MSRLSAHFLRGASLVVTDRRWAATLSAAALGFGLFIGVAIGPGATGTLATGITRIVEVPSSEEEGGPTAEVEAAPADPPSGAGTEAASFAAPPSPPAQVAPEAVEPAPPVEPTPPRPTPAPEETPQAETEVLKGTVVHANPAAGSYSLAIAGGELVSIHAPDLAMPGTKLSVRVRRLANGTFAGAAEPERLGRAQGATIRGTVSFVDPTPGAPAYTVSGRGASIRVGIQPDPTGAAAQLPAVGSYATVAVSIEKVPGGEVAQTLVPGQEGEPLPSAGTDVAAQVTPPSCAPDPSRPLPRMEPAAVLWQQKLQVEGEPSTYTDLAGMIVAICPESSQLLLSADDVRAGGRDVVLAVPATIATARLAIGDSFLATAAIGEGGALTLAGIASDEHVKGADDPVVAQGDLKR